MSDAAPVVTVKTLLGDYPNTLALKKGEIRSPGIVFEFADIKVPNTAFKDVVRNLKYDVAELAIVTYLQAKAHGKPLALLPAVVVGSVRGGADPRHQPLRAPVAQRGQQQRLRQCHGTHDGAHVHPEAARQPRHRRGKFKECERRLSRPIRRPG